MPELSDPRVGVVSRALHTFHGQGYCSMGKHNAGQSYHCFDEARALLEALDGENPPGDYRDPKATLTLSARQKRGR